MQSVADIILFWLRCGAALLLVGGTWYSSCVIAHRFFPEENAATRWCAQCVIGMSTATVGFHVFALPGCFYLLPGLVAVLLPAMGCRVRGASIRETAESQWADLRSAARCVLSSTERRQQYVLAAYGVLGIAVWQRSLLLPPVSWDALTYRAVKPAMWIRQGEVFLTDGPALWWADIGFPGGSEVLWAWAMLPFHSDLLLGTAGFVVWCFLGLSLYALCRTLGFSESKSIISAVFCAFIPTVYFAVGSAYADQTLALCTILAALFGVRFIQTGRPADLVFAFLCLGLTAGIKYRAYASIALAVPVLATYVLWSKRLSLRWIALTAAAVALMLIPAAPWWCYNTVVTGNPFYPQAESLVKTIRSIGIPGSETRDGASVADRDTHKQEVVDTTRPAFTKRLYERVRTEASAFAVMFMNNPRMPPAFGLPSVLPLLLFPVGLWMLLRTRGWTTLLLAGLALGFLLLYFSPPHESVRLLYPHTNARYLLTSFFLITIVSLYAVRKIPDYPLWNIVLIIPLVQLPARIAADWDLSEAPYGFAVTMAALGLYAVVGFVGARFHAKAVFAALVVGSVLFLTIAHTGKERMRPEAYLRCFFFHNFPRYWADAAASADEEDGEKRIAITIGEDRSSRLVFGYPFFGRKLQNRLVYVPASRSGDFEAFPAEGNPSGRGDFDVWTRRLASSKVTHVMSFRPATLELTWMKSHPNLFEPISTGEDFGLYRFHGRSGPSDR